MRVDNFPHNQHGITIQLGTVANTHCNHRWDYWDWKILLAAEVDLQGSTRTTHRLIIDNASIPDYVRSSEEFMLKLVSSKFGLTNHNNHDTTSR